MTPTNDNRSLTVPPEDDPGYLGKSGQKITVIGTVIGTITAAANSYGIMPPPSLRHLHLNCDGRDAIATTTETWAYQINCGDRIHIAATVQGHALWAGHPQTVLVDPQLLEPPSRPIPKPPTPSPPLRERTKGFTTPRSWFPDPPRSAPAPRQSGPTP